MNSKIFLLLLFWFHFHYESKAQDLIVLNTKDSINCKILKENNEVFIEVAMLVKNNIELATINLSDIASVRKNYFTSNLILKPICFDSIYTKDGELIIGKITEDKKDWYINYELPNQSKHSIPYTIVKQVVKCSFDSLESSSHIVALKSIQTNHNPTIKNVFENKKFRFALNGILAYRSGLNLNSFNKTIQNHFGQLKLNFGFGAEFHIALNKKRNFLFGAQYSSLFSSATSSNIQLTTKSGTTYVGQLNSNAYINTFGPSFLLKLGKGKSLHSCALQLGFQLVWYYEDLSIGTYNLSNLGTAISPSLQFLYEYKLDKNLSFGCNLGIEGGTITSVLINDNGNQTTRKLSKNEVINLGRIGFSVGVRYWF